MSIPRSLSAPEVALPKDERERPNVQRTASAAVVGTCTGAALSASAGIPRHVSSRDSEPEDPFNLGGFFPSGFGISARPGREQWSWLRFGEETSETAEGSYAGAMTPVSEDEEVPATPRTMLSHDGDAATEAAITQADMLGVLSLGNTMKTWVALPSPYRADDAPLDAESLHGALRALRETHTRAEEEKDGRLCSDGLFWPVSDEGLEELSSRHVPQGLQRLFDALDALAF